MKNQPLGLYIHWPFCLSKCPYCDFNSFVAQNIDVEAYQKAYFLEMERFYQKTPDHLLTTIFFGGGTPSLMPPSLTESLIQKALSLWESQERIEITLEANPSTAEKGRFQSFMVAGVNRLSIGIQSFQDESLAFLGRHHSAKEGLEALDLAQKIFPRVSFDLIYALPYQSLGPWKKELQYALSLGTRHLSLYQLTIEPGTAFAPRYKRGEFQLPEENLASDLYLLTEALCENEGLQSYEVSNYAADGHESQHNLIYWRYQDYVGIGPGAHGRYTHEGQKHATEQHRAPDIWLKKVLEEGNGNIRQAVLSPQEQACEAFMMGMRLKEGVSLSCIESLFPGTIDEKRLAVLQEKGHVEISKHKGEETILKATLEGRLRLNSVINYLLA